MANARTSFIPEPQRQKIAELAVHDAVEAGLLSNSAWDLVARAVNLYSERRAAAANATEADTRRIQEVANEIARGRWDALRSEHPGEETEAPSGSGDFMKPAGFILVREAAGAEPGTV